MGNFFGGGTKEILAEFRRVEEERRRADDERRRVEEERRRVEEERRRADDERRRVEEERRRADEEMHCEIRRELAKVSSLLLCTYEVVVRDFNAYAVMSETTVSRIETLKLSFKIISRLPTITANVRLPTHVYL